MNRLYLYFLILSVFPQLGGCLEHFNVKADIEAGSDAPVEEGSTEADEAEVVL